MIKKVHPLTGTLFVVLLTGLLLVACGQTSTPVVPTSGGVTIDTPEAPTSQPGDPTSQPEAPTSQPEASVVPTSISTLDGRALMQERCTKCHTTDRIESAHKTAEQWKTTVNRMISKGAELNPQEAQVLVDFLAQNFK